FEGVGEGCRLVCGVTIRSRATATLRRTGSGSKRGGRDQVRSNFREGLSTGGSISPEVTVDDLNSISEQAVPLEPRGRPLPLLDVVWLNISSAMIRVKKS
ncbi:22964_t:CDS:1, partial [Dentiscutata erythropus]